MHIRRAKNGTPSVHPIRGDEIRALRKLRRENPNEAYVSSRPDLARQAAIFR